MTPWIAKPVPFNIGQGAAAAASEPFDDTGLKAYWKFNESSGDIINQSESSVDLGSSADIQVTGVTYEDGGSPLGTGVSFDGTDDFGVAGSSLSNFNFLHNSTAAWTICMWAQLTKGDDRYIMSTSEGGTGIGLKLGMNTTDFRIYTQNGSDELIASFSGTSGFIPNASSWYFYCFTFGDALSGANFKATRNDANLESSGISANTPSNSNATDPMTFGKRPDLNIGYTKMALAEVSVWDKIMSDEDITTLYNSGNGLDIY